MLDDKSRWRKDASRLSGRRLVRGTGGRRHGEKAWGGGSGVVKGADLNLERNVDISGSNLVGLFVLKGEWLQAPAHPPAALPPPPQQHQPAPSFPGGDAAFRNQACGGDYLTCQSVLSNAQKPW